MIVYAKKNLEHIKLEYFFCKSCGYLSTTADKHDCESALTRSAVYFGGFQKDAISNRLKLIKKCASEEISNVCLKNSLRQDCLQKELNKLIIKSLEGDDVLYELCEDS